MAVTSLAAQLKRLETPQTSLLVHKTKKASFLFDDKEAANFDRETFYEIGISGLEELKKLNPHFSSFENTLFDITSKSFERAVETTEVNDKLNHHIKTFLTLLSPYFLLKPAHKTLEWLINRYHIHEYNINELLFLCLPYHETMTFARLLQLLPLAEDRGAWNWLYKVQKNGGPLSKTALLNRAASDMGFLKFVCQMPVQAIKVHGNKASNLGTLYAFYCTTLLGAIEHSKTITELHVSHMLPSIMSALSSSLPDFTSSGYIILALLLNKTKFGDKLLTSLYNKISKVNHVKLKTETTLMLVLLSQSEPFDVPLKAVKNLSISTWFIQGMEYWTSKEIVTVNLISSLLKTSLIAIEEGDDGLQAFAQALADLSFSSEDSIAVFNCILSTYKGNPLTDEWYRNLLLKLEARYPEGFDTSCCQALEKPKSKQAATLKKLLNVNTSRKTLFDQLVHPSPAVRASALQVIQNKYTAEQVSWLNKIVLERLNDDSTEVIKLALACKPALDSLPKERVFESLLRLTLKCWSDRQFDSCLEQSLLTTVNYVPDELADTLSVAVLPTVLTKADLLRVVASSPVLSQNTLIQFISKEVDSGTSCSDAVWKAVQSNLWPNEEAIKKIMNYLTDFHPVYKFLSLVVLASYENSINSSLVSEYLSFKQSNVLNDLLKNGEGFQRCIKSSRKGDLPVQGPLYVLSKFSCADLRWYNFDKNESLLNSLQILSSGSKTKDSGIRSLFASATDAFLQKTFDSLESRLNLLLCYGLFKPDDARWSLSLAQQLLTDNDELRRSSTAAPSPVVPLLTSLLHAEKEKTRERVLQVASLLVSSVSISPYHHFLQRIVDNSQEILLDPDQIVVFLYTHLSPTKEVQSLLPSEIRPSMKETLSSFIDLIKNDSTPLFLKSSLLEVLECVNSPDFLIDLLPTLADFIGDSRSLDPIESSVVIHILKKFNDARFVCFNNKVGWQYFEKILSDSTTQLIVPEAGPTVPAAFLIDQVSNELYERLPAPLDQSQERFTTLLVLNTYQCESLCVINSVSSMFKRIFIEGKTLVSLLGQWMKDTTTMTTSAVGVKSKGNERKRRSSSKLPKLELLETDDWKKGIFLLEHIQSKRKFSEVTQVLTALFNILNTCLLFEEQAPVEYPKQLLLSVIVKCCHCLDPKKLPLQSPQTTLQANLIVQCIRASQNPQTHHHALLALTIIAKILPDQVLHNIMDIFTFIGSSVLRQDDAYSFQIISKLVETIIPVLIESGKKKDVIGLVRVFVSAMLDVPEHRRLTLLRKLIVTLGECDHLWLFIALAIESHIMFPTQIQEMKSKDHDGQIPKKLEVSMQLCAEFPPKVILVTVNKLLEHAVSLPHDKDDNSNIQLPRTLLSIFDVKRNSPKQLRHYKYTLLMLSSSLLSSESFIRQFALISEEECQDLESVLAQLIELSLTYLKAVSKYSEETANLPNNKYWRVMLSHCYDVLDKATGLISSEMFVTVITTLLKRKKDSLNRKALELVGWRLSQGKPINSDSLLKLVQPVVWACLDPSTKVSPQEAALTKQTAFFSLKLLVRHLAPTNIGSFTEILGKLTDLLEDNKREKMAPEVLGSLLLSVGELVSGLKAHSIVYLGNIMPQVLAILDQYHNQVDLMLLSVITCLQKIVDTLCNFLSPYLSQILYRVSLIAAKCSDSPIDKAQSILVKLKAIRCKISQSVSVRVLVPSISWCYSSLTKENNLAAIAPLMAALSESFLSSAHPTLTPELSSFFLQALNFRCERMNEDVNLVEPYVMEALTSLVLKLSESAFRPLYHKLYDWAIRSVQSNENNKHRAITFYRLSSGIAESLRGLFALFAGLFVSNAATLLDANNINKTDVSWFKGDDDEKNNATACLLVDSILKTLLTVFNHDSYNFLTQERFETLLMPVVDQLDNRLGGDEALDKRCQDLLIPCIAAMSGATSDDSMWKQLNYQVLLKTRSHLSQVRLAGLEAVLAITKRLSEDFLPLLPETVPFLAELLEDSDEDIEKQTHIVISQMETVLGEPIQKYF